MKKLAVMTSFGPVPYEAVKKYLPKEAIGILEAGRDELFKAGKDKLLIAEKKSTPMCVGYYISSLAAKLGWKPEKMAGYLENLWEIYPVAAFSLILREIAIELDKKYKDHINNCEELYIISTMDGRIHKVPRAYATNLRNFAAFRTEEDAKIACKILKSDLKDMFSGRK